MLIWAFEPHSPSLHRNEVPGKKKHVLMTSLLTCAGVIINPDIAGVADTHKGAGCVHTHRVLPAVVFPLRTLIDICNHSTTQDTMYYDLNTFGRSSAKNHHSHCSCDQLAAFVKGAGRSSHHKHSVVRRTVLFTLLQETVKTVKYQEHQHHVWMFRWILKGKHKKCNYDYLTI